jgi:hypothetical protein
MKGSILRRAACAASLAIFALALLGGGVAQAATLSFGPKMDFGAGTRPLSVTSGDFDRDGDLDLATANIGEAVSVLLNTGNGTYGAPTQFATGMNTEPYSVTSGDFDRRW